MWIVICKYSNGLTLCLDKPTWSFFWFDWRQKEILVLSNRVYALISSFPYALRSSLHLPEFYSRTSELQGQTLELLEAEGPISYCITVHACQAKHVFNLWLGQNSLWIVLLFEIVLWIFDESEVTI